MKKAIVILYLLLIFIPVTSVLFNEISISDISSSNKFKLWPKKSFLQGVFTPSNYINELELAFVDRLPFKVELLKFLGQIEYSFFNVAKEVIIGNDGWLTDRITSKDRLVRLDSIDDEVIKKTIIRIKKLQYYIESHGGKFVITIVPLKPSIYPEHFRDKEYLSRPDLTGLDRFQLALKNNNISYVDLKTPLISSKGETPLFYKTDVHWNSAGVTIAAKEILAYLSFITRNSSYLWQENADKSTFEFSGGEAASIPKFKKITELAPRWSGQKEYIKLMPGADAIQGGDTFKGVNKDKALLPPTLMFGNSFMLEYPGVGYHNYFKKSQELLDYQYFSKVLDYINNDTKIYILHLYETQLLFHLMDLNSYYWDKNIDDIPLPAGYTYKE